MRITKSCIHLLFALLLILFSTCRKPCYDVDQTTNDIIHTDMQQVCQIDNHLHEFILSRLYMLSGDTIPAYNVIIEFAMRNKDTLFEISVLSEIYKDLLNDTKIGCITTDDFRLFVLDKDSLCSSYYQIDSIWLKQLPYDRSLVFWTIEGVLSNGIFFEKFPNMNHPDVEFVLDHPNPIR